MGHESVPKGYREQLQRGKSPELRPEVAPDIRSSASYNSRVPASLHVGSRMKIASILFLAGRGFHNGRRKPCAI